jgi:hypothetical protein
LKLLQFIILKLFFSIEKQAKLIVTFLLFSTLIFPNSSLASKRYTLPYIRSSCDLFLQSSFQGGTRFTTASFVSFEILGKNFLYFPLDHYNDAFVLLDKNDPFSTIRLTGLTFTPISTKKSGQYLLIRSFDSRAEAQLFKFSENTNNSIKIEKINLPENTKILDLSAHNGLVLLSKELNPVKTN